MTVPQDLLTPRVMFFCRLALALCLMVSLWGCNESRPRRHGGGGGGLSPADEVAQLLAENEPFEFDFDLEDIHGKRVSKADFAGKVLIVDIWGTWCPPCRGEIPHFVALDQEYRDRGLQIVGLNFEQVDNAKVAMKQVRQFCDAEGVRYPCALAGERIIRQVPDFEGFPTTLFFDHTGKVRMRVVGYHEPAFLKAAVEALLKDMPTGQTAHPAEGEQPDDAGEKPVEK
ncbi:MAG: TlpA family protein disulfide reductase [Deltaproteobacteria bacterium]